MSEFTRRSVSELLRDAANRLDELERAPTSEESQEGEARRGTRTSKELKLLMQFWTGWDVVPQHLDVEIAEITLPQSSTCFFTLKLPKDTDNFDAFRGKLMASISSSYAGFGQY